MKKNLQIINSNSLYEANYAKLLRVIPCIKSLTAKAQILSTTNNQKIEITTLEKTKYTTAIAVSLTQHVNHQWLPNLCMVIRTYHDARVAEVINFQNHTRILPRYTYPNLKMYQKNEKRQINQFFCDWLNYCLKTRCIFDDNVEPIDA